MSIIFRQNSCVIEYSEDNGTTWSLVADLNQCFSAQIVGVPGEALRCSIASWIADALEAMQNTIIEGENQDVDNGTLVASVLTLLGALGAATTAGASVLIAGAAVYVGTAIQTILIGNYSNALTAAFYDYAKCQLYCLLPDDGNVTAVTVNAWADSIRSYTGSDTAVMNTVADYIVQLPLETWRSLAAVAAAAQVEGDCSQCECVPDCQLIADSTNGTPDPVQDPNDSTLWMLSSTSTPNEDGYYVVRYHLPYPKSCCRFEIGGEFSVSHPSGIPFAGFRGCGLYEGYDQEFSYQTTPTVVDLYSVGHDTKPCFNALYIRMNQPFTLQVRVAACEEEWCCEFDFTLDDYEWMIENTCGVNFAAYSAGWNTVGGLKNPGSNCANEATWRICSIALPLTAHIIYAKLTYDYTAGGGYKAVTLAHKVSSPFSPGGTTMLTGSTTTGTNKTAEASGDWNVDGYLHLKIWASETSPAGSAKVLRLELRGIGEKPLGIPDCM